MNHPEKILRTLDAYLAKETRLILYGRAALALGFSHSQPDFHSTLDVDAILPEVEMAMIDEDDQFWTAIEKTNDELKSSGLYITHLFTESQVILSPSWLDQIEPIKFLGLQYLRPFRPSVGDLILTKMMRIDPQDRSDIEFLLSHLDLSTRQIEELIATARVPEITEIKVAFEKNSHWLFEKFSEV